MEATVLEVHLIITGRLDVVSVHLQNNINVLPKKGEEQRRAAWS